jgi:LuxR family maltose regulon positive regulatory protein
MDDELVDAYQVQLWIAGGHTGMAKRWAERNNLETLVHIEVDEARFDPIWEIRSQTLARLYLIEGNYDSALKVIEPMLQVVRVQGRIRSVLKALAFQALILRELGKVQEALQSLEEALLLAQEEGFVSVFLDEGEPMVELLYEAASQGVVPEYVGQLLEAYISPARSSQPARLIGQDQADLVEPLSDRELDVLELIAEGLSNQEIAGQLHISLSTVKGHTTSIYGKLGVHKRTQAVATAQTLGILPSS